MEKQKGSTATQTRRAKRASLLPSPRHLPSIQCRGRGSKRDAHAHSSSMVSVLCFCLSVCRVCLPFLVSLSFLSFLHLLLLFLLFPSPFRFPSNSQTNHWLIQLTPTCLFLIPHSSCLLIQSLHNSNSAALPTASLSLQLLTQLHHSHSRFSDMTPSSTPFGAVRRLPQSINNGSLILQDMLGVGAYGAVYRAIDTTTAEIRAVKCLHTSGLSNHQRAFQNHEASLHALVSGHPHIATLHKVVEEDDCLYMVLDCGVEGDLFFTITERGGFVGNEVAIKSIFGQITSAVEHCHSMGVYHRDLKPENIIMFGSTVKLVDFGLATTEKTSSDFGCGSTFYLSPECQGGYVEQVKNYDSAANDVWSLGVILINLVFGRNPWKQACPRDDTFSAYVLNHNFLQTILPMSTELNEIIKSVFCLNPKKRISLPELTRRVLECRCFTTSDFSAPPPPSPPTAVVAVASPRTVTKTRATMIAARAATASLPLTKGEVPTAIAAIGSCIGSDPEQQQQGLGQDSGVDFHSMA